MSRKKCYWDEKEKVKVIEGVNELNPDLPEETEVTVDNKGNVTITYPDRSKDIIKGNYLVYVKVSTKLPNTGVDGLTSGLIGFVSASFAGIFLSRRKMMNNLYQYMENLIKTKLVEFF